MNSDASLDEENRPTELDQMIQDEFFDSSDLDEEVDMIMLMSMKRNGITGNGLNQREASYQSR